MIIFPSVSSRFERNMITVFVVMARYVPYIIYLFTYFDTKYL